MRLTTVGRHSGKTRSVILGYYEDGPNLVTMAMNGWKDAEPAWWLNLQAHPDATVELPDSTRAIKGGRRKATSANASGADGARWVTTSTGTPLAARPGPRSSSSNRGPLPHEAVTLRRSQRFGSHVRSTGAHSIADGQPFSWVSLSLPRPRARARRSCSTPRSRSRTKSPRRA